MYHYHHGFPAHLHQNGACPHSDTPAFQVVDITSDSITIEVKNMKGRAICIYEVSYMQKDLSPENGTLVAKEYFSVSNTTRLIIGLKPFTCYNITIIENVGPGVSKERVRLDLPILTFYDFKNSMTKLEYETTYKTQFDLSKYPGLLPLSWSHGKDTRAEISDWSFHSRNFFVRGEPIDVSDDGINDRNDYTEAYWHADIKRFYFPALGIHVYECPFKPGYFNVNSTLAILGKTQCYVEIWEIGAIGYLSILYRS